MKLSDFRISAACRRGRKARVEIFPPSDPMGRRADFRIRRAWTAIAAAVVGTAAGIVGAAVTGRMGDARASYAVELDLRDAPLAGSTGSRAEMIASIAVGETPERLTVPTVGAQLQGNSAPRLIIIFDDMGLDRAAFDRIMSMPGPVTLSFLPYARDVQIQADRARERGDDILLHLPMEPSGGADPGPNSLSLGMSAQELFDALSWNLGRFEGYVGVNNHMGSKFTRDEQMMKRVLSYLDQRGAFFIDSLTTGSSAASRAGAAVGADVFVRDVFLDSEPGAANIRRQLHLAERIAVKTGYAIVICHPRSETLDVIGAWLTSAPARGFRLDTVSSLKHADRILAASAAM